jgi:hypothetical protein
VFVTVAVRLRLSPTTTDLSTESIPTANSAVGGVTATVELSISMMLSSSTCKTPSRV